MHKLARERHFARSSECELVPPIQFRFQSRSHSRLAIARCRCRLSRVRRGKRRKKKTRERERERERNEGRTRKGEATRKRAEERNSRCAVAREGGALFSARVRTTTCRCVRGDTTTGSWRPPSDLASVGRFQLCRVELRRSNTRLHIG